MIVYNISVKLNSTIEKEWVQWQQQEHIPEVMASGQFIDHKFYKLLELADDEDTATYIVQYFAKSIDRYHHYIKHAAPVLRQKALDKWGNQFIAFRSVMQSVH
ncbi:MAG: DUF4286 family protein [Chitinophagaceae bacterium]|nr:DUF4286 family protein [Chitinophagaceae bacterium]